MNSCKFSIPIVTAGMLAFTLVCNSRMDVPSEFLIAFLVLLHAGMVWMVITILKDSRPPVENYNNGTMQKINVNDQLGLEQ